MNRGKDNQPRSTRGYRVFIVLCVLRPLRSGMKKSATDMLFHVSSTYRRFMADSVVPVNSDASLVG